MAVSTTLFSVTSGSWADLGAGPSLLHAIGTQVRIIIADSVPGASDPGFALDPSGLPVCFNTTSHLWAKGSSAGSVLSAPISAGATQVLPTLVTGSTITRPADTTAYAFGDLVANSVTAGSVTPGTLALARAINQAGTIRSARLITSSNNLTNAIFRIHFYSASPVVVNGDNGAWLSSGAGYLGSLDVTVDRAFSDSAVVSAQGIGGPSYGVEVPFVPAAGTTTVYYLIEARGAYTPTSGETFIPVVEVQ